MTRRYVPPLAEAAARQASRERARYQQAVAEVRKDRSTTKGQKRELLNRLQEVYQRRMQELRAQRNRAYQDAENDALRRIARPGNGRQIKDSYHAHRHRLREAPLQTLIEEYEWAELADDGLLMKVCATLALARRTPLPEDHASALVDRYCNARLPGGNYLDPEAGIGWERLQGLARTTEEVLQETAVYSVSNRPEPVEDSTPVDPREAAAAKLAELYPVDGPAPANGQGEQ
jgi:hypothetical protein